MDVCYRRFLYFTLSTFNLSVNSWKKCITLHKKFWRGWSKTRWLEPLMLSPIASATIRFIYSNFRNGIVVNGEVRYLILCTYWCTYKSVARPHWGTFDSQLPTCIK